MPAEHLSAWSPEALVAAKGALRDLLDAGAGAASITFHDEADALLGTATLAEPCGTIDGVTAVMTLIIAVQVAEALGAGNIAYCSVRDGAGVVHVSLPPVVGSAPVVGAVVVNTTEVFVGGPIQILSATI